MDDIFHRYYAEHRTACGLTVGAVELLRVAFDGAQSVDLSMYVHEELVPLVRGFGIEPRLIGWTGGPGRRGSRPSTWCGTSRR